MMQMVPIQVSARVIEVNRQVEQVVNRVVRGYDTCKERLHIGGRKARYDDARYEFVGGASETMRKKHYDKSLRLLWKAEKHAPWSSFRDCTREERQLVQMAEQAMNEEERALRKRMSGKEFRAQLSALYTREQRQAIVTVLSAIGHGEAYAWLVSAELLGEVQSTGAKAALTMQVLEEAKHFVVLREFLHAFDVGVPRQSAWEYILLEQVYKADGLEKLFGMNVLVEGIALSLFGLLAHQPGCEVLRLFHLDESRHTALPVNYFAEFPMSPWQRGNPLARANRIRMLAPAIPLVFLLEEPLAVLGVDALAFGGSVIRKITFLSERAGFMERGSGDVLGATINKLFNAYAKLTRPDHAWHDYHLADTTVGDEVRKVEAEIFDAA